MTTLIKATSVRFDNDQMWVELDDGRTLGIPLAWYPRLLHGTPELRDQVTISPSGLHWQALDEDISIAGLIAGRQNIRLTERIAVWGWLNSSITSNLIQLASLISSILRQNMFIIFRNKIKNILTNSLKYRESVILLKLNVCLLILSLQPLMIVNLLNLRATW